VELRKAHKESRGSRRTLEKASATMDALHRKISRIGEENEAMVQ
jgi:hypothetical protein